MEKIIEIKDLTFKYPDSDTPAVNNASLTVNAGEYIVIAGKSGCGKTTLLKQLKPCIAPYGKRTGEILFHGKDIYDMSDKEQASKIGFVMQDPDEQTVTDKVWHELAFGLENLGIENDTIRLRVAETAEYFGISELFGKNTAELSGGEKQLMNLAAVTAMRPEVLIFDEPVSQLDPVAASSFLQTVAKLNRDFGITVIITEHRPDGIFPFADRILIMDKGEILSVDTPENTAKSITDSFRDHIYMLPVPAKIYSEISNGDLPCPLTVREGRQWLSSAVRNPQFTECERKDQTETPVLLRLRDVYYSYARKENAVLKGLSCEFRKNKLTCILGGNGAGKSTLLKIISGIYKPVSGKVRHDKIRIAYMPQQTENLFTENTVRAELELMGKDIDNAAELTQIENLLNRHPFDLSGGEKQRAGLAKLLMTQPDLLLLDEPTKGMDGEFKAQFAAILKKLAAKGCTVIIVSHDIEFCAEYTDICMMLFDGKIVSSKYTNEFFSQNMFYTTSARSMSSHIFKNAITSEETVELCKKNLK